MDQEEKKEEDEEDRTAPGFGSSLLTKAFLSSDSIQLCSKGVLETAEQ